MLRVRWYKVLSDLFSNKTRTLLIVLSIAVGLIAVGTILSAQVILSNGLAHSFAAINPSSGTVRTYELFDEDYLQSVRSMPDVQDADARRSVAVRVKTGTDEWKNITLFVFADYDDIRVNKVTSQSGAWPPPYREALIERAALPLLNARVGDTLEFKMPNDTLRKMRIAGTAYDPAQLPAPIDSTPYGYITFDTLDWLGDSYGFNELHVVSTHPEDKAWAGQVVNRVKSKAEKSGYSIPMSMTADPGQLPMNDILQAILLLMGALGVMSLFLSIFLVVNTVSSILTQQRRQIGVMKAIGGSSLQILGMYLAMVAAYGLLALLIAVPVSAFGAGALSRMLAVFFNIDLASTALQPRAVLIQTAIGLLLPVLASLYPFLTSVGISPAEAMSAFQVGKGRFGKSPIDRLLSGSNLWFARRLALRSLLLSLRNIFRSKGRLALTLLTLTLGSATFISVFSVRSSLFSTVNDMIGWMNFDLMIVLDRSYRAEFVQSEAASVPGVTNTDVWLQFPVRRVRPDDSEGDMIYLFTPASDSKLIVSPGMTAGRWFLPEDENALVVTSSLLKDESDLAIGSDMILKLDGHKRKFKIVGAYSGSSFAAMIFTNYSYTSKLTNRTHEADTLLVNTWAHDLASVTTVSNALEKRFEHSGIRINSITSIFGEKADAIVIFDAIVLLLLVMAGLLALVGGLGLMGTMSINVLERTREIGVLRAIGAPNLGVLKVFILEGVVIGVISWFLGAFLAIPLSQGLAKIVGETMMGTPLTFSYSYPGLWLWLVLVILLSALSSYIPARNAARLTVREVLAYE